MVLVDLSRELDEGVRNEILKMATINLYIAGQKLRSLDYYIQLKTLQQLHNLLVNKTSF